MTDPPEHSDIHVRPPLAHAQQAGLLGQAPVMKPEQLAETN
ncbi:MAG: hypothetical protein OXE42_13725 [Gammaproteobacteria bacterium]|nr:hypothetical protein [Gammaproteobacteria bacterium]